jgi:ribosomal protein S8
MKILNKKIKKKIIDAVSAFNLTKHSEFELKIQKVLDDSYISDSFDQIKSASKRGELSVELNYDETLEEVLNKLGYKTRKKEFHRGYDSLLVSWDIQKEIQHEKE